MPAANLTIYQKIVYYQEIKIYSYLQKTIGELSGDKNKFKITLKRYCYITAAAAAYRNIVVHN